METGRSRRVDMLMAMWACGEDVTEAELVAIRDKRFEEWPKELQERTRRYGGAKVGEPSPVPPG